VIKMAPKKKSTKTKKQKTGNKAACWILVVSGVLMIIGGVINGPGIIGAIGQLLVQSQLITNPLLVLLITGIVWICAIFGFFGGFSVIFGAYTISKNHIRLGKLIVGLGAGGGLFTLIILVLLALSWGVYAFLGLIWALTHSIGAIGVLISIYGRRKVK
jgi:hypothetical protein